MAAQVADEGAEIARHLVVREQHREQAVSVTRVVHHFARALDCRARIPDRELDLVGGFLGRAQSGIRFLDHAIDFFRGIGKRSGRLAQVGKGFL